MAWVRPSAQGASNGGSSGQPAQRPLIAPPAWGAGSIGAPTISTPALPNPSLKWGGPWIFPTDHLISQQVDLPTPPGAFTLTGRLCSLSSQDGFNSMGFTLLTTAYVYYIGVRVSSPGSPFVTPCIGRWTTNGLVYSGQADAVFPYLVAEYSFPTWVTATRGVGGELTVNLSTDGYNDCDLSATMAAGVGGVTGVPVWLGLGSQLSAGQGGRVYDFKCDSMELTTP